MKHGICGLSIEEHWLGVQVLLFIVIRHSHILVLYEASRPTGWLYR